MKCIVSRDKLQVSFYFSSYAIILHTTHTHTHTVTHTHTHAHTHTHTHTHIADKSNFKKPVTPKAGAPGLANIV